MSLAKSDALRSSRTVIALFPSYNLSIGFRDWRIYPRLFLESRIFGYNHALVMKVDSGRWIVDSG